MIENPTIVTAIFDIGRDKWEHYNLSYNTYLHWMRNLLMFDTHMVIYTEKKFYDFVINHRKVVDPNLEKTIVVIKDFTELDSYRLYFEKIKSVMENDNFKGRIQFQVPEMTKPLYNTIIFNKLYFIKNSIDEKHFNSNFFIWCDSGVLRDDHPNIKKGFPNIDKIKDYTDKITFFSHHIDFSTNDKNFHLVSQFRYIHGGCFFVPNNGVLDKLILDFQKEINDSFERGFVGSEEKYLDFCYLNNKNDYNIVKSDWRQYFDIFGT
jgi:hypothetical protein